MQLEKVLIECIQDKKLKNNKNKSIYWAPVTRNSFQGRTRGIRSSIFRGNNIWPVRMPLRMSRISRPSLVDRKPVRKPKKMMIFKNRGWIFHNLIKLRCEVRIVPRIHTFSEHILSGDSLTHIFTFRIWIFGVSKRILEEVLIPFGNRGWI